MSRKSTPSPSIISKRRQNNVSNTAILQVVSKREPFMNINDLVKYISENKNFHNDNVSAKSCSDGSFNVCVQEHSSSTWGSIT